MAEAVKIIVVSADGCHEVHFRIKMDCKMLKVKNAFADRSGLDVRVCRFLYDSKRIQDDDTPRSLGMEDHDVVEMYVGIL